MKLITVLLMLVLPAVEAVELAAEYHAGVAGNPPAAPSPATQGWTAVTPTTDVGNFVNAGVSPDGTSGLNAWRVLDNSTATSQFLYWTRAFTARQQTDAAAYGWRLVSHMRIADPVAGNAGANSAYLFFGNNANRRWIIFFDVNSAGQLVASLQGGSVVTLTGVDATLHHTHEIVYSPATQQAEYLVNGTVRASGWAGTTGTANGVRFGTESSGGRGDSYWNRVRFEINDPPVPPVPAATAHPASVSAVEGTAVTLTATFSGSPASYQWLKDTVPVAGATAATLTIASVTPADAGDYWCRATNATGSGSSRSAALEVLTAGGGIMISEIVAENDSGLRDADGQQSDWIELHNTASAPLSTAGFFLTDDPLRPQKWALPAETIPAGGFLLVWASGKDRAVAGSELHTNFALGNNAGEHLALTRPDGTAAAAFTCPEQFADNGWGLTVHQPARLRYFMEPTPRALNVDGQTAVKDFLAMTPASGTFTGSLNVSLATSAEAGQGGTLRFTTDGRLPEFDSPPVPGDLQVALAGTTALRAAIIHSGERYGATATGAYHRLGADVQAFSSPLPLLVLSNHGAGAVPGVSARGPNGDGSQVTAVPMQPHTLLVLDAPTGDTTLTSPVVNRTRAGLKLRGSSSFTFAEKSYTLDTWDERDGRERDVPLAGLPADSDWVIYGPDPAQFDNTLIHNSIAYELARAGGFPAPRFRFVELFLDGGGDLTMADHRGLAILVEKPSRGGSRIDFDHLNADGTAGGWMISVDRMDAVTDEVPVPRHFHTAGPDRVLQTPDDNPRGYQSITVPGGTGSGSGILPANDDMPNFYHSFFKFESPRSAVLTSAQRTAIQGAMRAFDAALYGPDYLNATTGYWPHIDVPNWAHHLLIHAFLKNQDAVVLSSFVHRETPEAPLRWSSLWDFDRAFDRNTSGGSTGDAALTWAHDRMFYRRLTTDPEFMQAYIDKWHEMRRGPWTNAAMTALVDAQAAEITATVAARSGLTAAVWTANLTTMKTWLTDRAGAMDQLYTRSPVLSHPGGAVPAGFTVSLTAPAGTIFLTTDGSDPRLRGGAVAPSATAYAGPLVVTDPLTVRARVRNGAAWSGLVSGTWFPPQDLRQLRVTEIHYHPPDQASPIVDGDEYEFIELRNTGAAPLEVGGVAFIAGITYTFPSGTVIPSGGYVVLVRNEARFLERFPGCTPFGTYADRLNNAGEVLTLASGSEVLWSFSFDDALPWRPEADGDGLSLQRPAPTMPGHDPLTWTAAAPTPCAGLSGADTDSDGLPDYWESLFGATDGRSDDDGDAATNADEVAAGTDPRDAASVFRLRAATAAAGEVAFEFVAMPGRAYRIESSTDLGGWGTERTVAAGEGMRLERFAVPTGAARRFYRVVVP